MIFLEVSRQSNSSVMLITLFLTVAVYHAVFDLYTAFNMY